MLHFIRFAGAVGFFSCALCANVAAQGSRVVSGAGQPRKKGAITIPSFARAMCVFAVTFGLLLSSSANGGVTTTGSVLDSGSTYYAGYTANGSVTIDGGSVLDR